jgi:hypothetical protein
MTVKELKEKLNKFPDNTDVFVDERYTEFTYGIVNSVHMMEIDLVEEPGGDSLAQQDVVIISEE